MGGLHLVPITAHDARLILVAVALSVAACLLAYFLGHRRELSRLRDALDAMPDGLALFDAKDRLIAWNTRYQTLRYGLPLYYGQPYAEIVRQGLAADLFVDPDTDKDAWLGQQPDERVSGDPEDPHFSLTFGGEAYFVVGLHPHASRPARRFDRPVLVFNLHDQFERLRAEGRYEKMREKIIARDVALAGTPNPMLERHGDASAARQFSGRAVNDDWKCPFRDPRA